MAGRTILQYQLLEKLGEGGMGEVYKAQDTRLNRFVAIKLLPQSKTGDPSRRRRFVQEAQAASALNHPNIITIHDIVSDNETDSEYMVMEYIGGKTLIDVIPNGGLRTPQALQYAVQIADALGAAHAAGIVHRDLKPGNVMVTATGLVKILDFGLAKLTDASPISQSDVTMSIGSGALTVEGSILGTLSYMSPEQAQGKRVDSRSDIFSFGALLYEMLTGRRAFEGDTALDTLTAILRDDAKPLTQVAPDVPPQLEQIIARCLRKNPDDRWQTMQEVRAELNILKQQSDSGGLYKSQIQLPPPKRGPSKAMLAGIAAAVVVAFAGAGGWWWKSHRSQPQPPVAVTAPPPAIVPPPAPVPTPAPVTAPVTAPVPEPPPMHSAGVLTNNSIIDMVKAKVPVPVILAHIRGSKTKFDLSTAAVIQLTKAGVPGNVVEVMHDPKAPAPASAAASTPTSNPTPAPTSATTPTTTAVAPPAPPVAPPTTPPAVTTTPAANLTIRDGLPVSIMLSQDIPNDVEEGAAIHFTVAADLKVGDAVVIAKGASVSGQIADAAKKKFLGRGKITYRLEKVDGVDGRKLSVRAASSRRGEDSTRPLDAGKGPKSKELAAAKGSTGYLAYIDGEQTVAVHK